MISGQIIHPFIVAIFVLTWEVKLHTIVSVRENCVCKALGTVPWYTEYFRNKLQTITVTSMARLSLSMLDILVMMNNKIVNGEGNLVSQKEGRVRACLRVETLNPFCSAAWM